MRLPRSTLRALAGLLVFGSGCFAPLFTIAERSAIEQELTSAALRHALSKLDLAALDRDRRYTLQLAAPRGSDEALIRARLEERLADAGLRLSDDAGSEGSRISAVVPFSGADVQSSLLGLPFVVPGLPVALGDISLYRSSTLTGRARVELSLWVGADREPIDAAEASRRYRNLTFLTFFGPFRWTDLERNPLPGNEERRRAAEEEADR